MKTRLLSPEDHEPGQGLHLALDCVGCDKAKLEDTSFLSNFLGSFIEQDFRMLIGLGPEVEFVDAGFLGFVGNAAAHISIHTFPQSGWLFIDVFNCNGFSLDDVEDSILETFDVSEYERHDISRGRLFQRDNI